MIKITALSDLHGYYPKLDGGDLLIIAGDCTASDKTTQWGEFLVWLNLQDYEKIILVAGNHDSFLTKFLSTNHESKCHYLLDSGTEYRGLKFWGSPHSNLFDNVNPRCKAFMDRDCHIAKHFERIPDDIDVLVTHSPAFETLDDGKGSYSLKKEIERVKPVIVFHGHIHECGNQYLVKGDTTYVNASFVDRQYKPRNEYMEVLFDEKAKKIVEVKTCLTTS